MDRVVIDAHLHLWNTERLRYEWLQRPENAAINRTFGFEDFRARPPRPEWTGPSWSRRTTPPRTPRRCSRSRRHTPSFAGIRTLIHDQPDPDWLLRPEVGEGLALLERTAVPFDVISVLPGT